MLEQKKKMIVFFFFKNKPIFPGHETDRFFSVFPLPPPQVKQPARYWTKRSPSSSPGPRRSSLPSVTPSRCPAKCPRQVRESTFQRSSWHQSGISLLDPRLVSARRSLMAFSGVRFIFRSRCDLHRFHTAHKLLMGAGCYQRNRWRQRKVIMIYGWCWSNLLSHLEDYGNIWRNSIDNFRIGNKLFSVNFVIPFFGSRFKYSFFNFFCQQLSDNFYLIYTQITICHSFLQRYFKHIWFFATLATMILKKRKVGFIL